MSHVLKACATCTTDKPISEFLDERFREWRNCETCREKLRVQRVKHATPTMTLAEREAIAFAGLSKQEIPQRSLGHALSKVTAES